MKNENKKKVCPSSDGISRYNGSLQNLLQLLFLVWRQRGRELDVDAHDEISSLVWLFALWHAEAWVSVDVCWAGRTSRADTYLLAVDCLDSPLPAGEGFLQVNIDVVSEVVAFTLVQRVFFL